MPSWKAVLWNRMPNNFDTVWLQATGRTAIFSESLKCVSQCASHLCKQCCYCQCHGCVRDVITVMIYSFEWLAKCSGPGDCDGVGAPFHLGSHQTHHLGKTLVTLQANRGRTAAGWTTAGWISQAAEQVCCNRMRNYNSRTRS